MYSWSPIFPIFLLDSPATFRAKICHANEVVTRLTSLTQQHCWCLRALRTLTPDLRAHAFDPTLTPVHLLLRSCQLMNLVAYLEVSVTCLLALFFLQPCAHSSMSRSLVARHSVKWHSLDHSWTLKQWSEQETQSRALSVAQAALAFAIKVKVVPSSAAPAQQKWRAGHRHRMTLPSRYQDQ